MYLSKSAHTNLLLIWRQPPVDTCFYQPTRATLYQIHLTHFSVPVHSLSRFATLSRSMWATPTCPTHHNNQTTTQARSTTPLPTFDTCTFPGHNSNPPTSIIQLTGLLIPTLTYVNNFCNSNPTTTKASSICFSSLPLTHSPPGCRRWPEHASRSCRIPSSRLRILRRLCPAPCSTSPRA